MNNTTLKEISNALNISISTVSRALNGHPDISEKTKQRVLELSKTLDYEPNASAIQLRTAKSNLFGLVVPFISNYFYHSFISAIEEECRKIGFSLMILQSGSDPATEAANIRLCRQNRISGLFACISSQANLESYFKLQKLDIPVIFFDKVPDADNCNKVCVADDNSAILAATAILEKDKKKVLVLMGNKDLLITRKRLSAFTKTIGDKIEMVVLYADNAAEAEEVTLTCLQQQPDTVFCMSDEVLTGAMKAIRKSGLIVPLNISVIAISNGFIPKLYYPEITYVETSGYKLGKLAFTRMSECRAGSSEVKELTSETELIEGGSMS